MTIKNFLKLFAFILVSLITCGCQRKVTDHDPVDTIVTEGIIESSEAINQQESLSDMEEEYFIYVTGAVNNPGVYSAKPGDRVYSVINAAGGLREDACDTWINQAQKLDDGLMINIPTMEEVGAISGDDPQNYGTINRETTNPGNENRGITAQGNTTQGNTAQWNTIHGSPTLENRVQGNTDQGNNNGLININLADTETLSTLPGIGNTKAQAIISYREEIGGFTAIEQIMEVSGIGESSFNKIKSFICI